MDSKEHIVDELPAYALGALDEADALTVAEHLAGCEFCRAELAAYEGVVENLALAGPEAEPPPRLKTELLRRVDREVAARQRSPTLAERLRAFFRNPAPAWGFSLLLLIALIASNLLLWQRVQGLEAQQTGGLMVLAMQGTDSAPEAAARMVIGRDDHVGVLVVDGLMPLDETRQYQLWLKRGDQRISGGVFSVLDTGYGLLRVWSAEPLSQFSGFGVTIEPSGGSPGPTGEQVLNLDL